MKEEYTWEYFKEDTPINIKVNNNKTIQSISERSAKLNTIHLYLVSSAQLFSLLTTVSESVPKSLFLAPTNQYGTPTLSVASFAISTKRSRVLYTS